MMHEMDKTPRILTIIGLVFEGFSVFGYILGAFIFRNIAGFPGVTPEALELTIDEFNEMMDIFVWLGDIMYVIAIIITIVFVANLFLFGRLLSGKYEEEQAKKLYLYQAIWGGINVMFNQITAIMYLVSGVSGYSGHKEERNIREGI